MDLQERTITIRNAKSAAGNRVVPIHPSIAPLIHQRVGNRAEGNLLGLASGDQYKRLSGPLGQKFTRLKRVMGFDGRYVFHSIRKTVTTMLENGEVLENVAAAILGHDIPTMTYGLYSGGSGLALTRKAIEVVLYPSNPGE